MPLAVRSYICLRCFVCCSPWNKHHVTRSRPQKNPLCGCKECSTQCQSMDGGLALLLYLDRTPFRRQHTCRGGGGGRDAIGHSATLVREFEAFLDECVFCLRSEDKDKKSITLPLKRVDHAQRHDASTVLCQVSERWQKIMSRFSFELEHERDRAKLNQTPDWVLQLASIPPGQYWMTHVACFPQA